MTESLMKRLLVLSLLAACGDDNNNPGEPDAGVDAPAAPITRAVVVAGDFNPGSPGVMSVVDVAAGTIETNVAPAGAVGEDPILRHIGDELLVVNRAAGNNVTILDASTFALVEQLGTGTGSNPQDVAVVGDTLFVATFGGTGLVALTRGSSTITPIDLSADDPDGKPNCSSVYRKGPNLFVACGLLDDTMMYLPPRGPAKVYVVSVATKQIVDTLTLTTKNPIALFEEIPMFAPNAGDLVLPTVDFATGEGCVERITTTTPDAAGCLVTNADLGNFAGRIAFHAVEFTGPVAPIVIPPMMYAVVPAADFSGSDVIPYEMSGATVMGKLNTVGVMGDVATCANGTIVVADSTMENSGVRIHNGNAFGEPLAVGLRPQSTHGLVCY